MSARLAILHLEDNAHDAALVDATLAADGIVADIVRVDSRSGFAAALQSGRFDVILADYNLPAFDGQSAHVMAAGATPDTPFIFLSGSIGEELAIERVKAGATDYVLKDRMARLPSAVRRALAEAAERLERQRAEADVRRLNAELERRVAERTMALAESQRRLQAILHYSPAAIALKDLAGRYLLTNREFDALAELPAGGAAGKDDTELFPPRLADVYAANDAQVLEQRRGLEFEETYLRGDAAHIYHAIRFPLLDPAGQPSAVCSIAIDVTDRKKTDDALRIARLEAERANRAKSAFLSNMSHDLRTPLNAILGFAQLLELDDLAAGGRESVAQILRGGTHLLALINEVLDIARIEAGHLSLSMEPVHAVEIAELAAELVRPLAGQRGIAITIVPPAADIVVLADRQRLSQVLINLLSNAVKYNRPQGSVTITFEADGAGRARLMVTDTGAGISEEKRQLLFQPFERLGAEHSPIEGTGLGLALSRGLAEAMGGTLGVDSEIDRGSTFWIELACTDAPQARRAAREERPHGSGPDPAGTRGVLLYIEDNQSNVRLMQRVLERRPAVRLLHASDGQTGLALAAAERPDLIFLDLHLPDMSGEEVLRRLCGDPLLRHIPVAVLSADATPTQSRRLTASGAMAYLTKPLDIRQIMDMLDERLARASQESER